MEEITIELLDKNFDTETEINTLINNLGICAGHIVKENNLPVKVIIVHPLTLKFFKDDLDSLIILIIHEQILESFRYFKVKEPIERADKILMSRYDEADILKAFLKLSDFITSKNFRNRVSLLLKQNKFSVWLAAKEIKYGYSIELNKRFNV